MIYTIESDDEIELEITSDEDSDSDQIILSSNKKGVVATKKKPVKKSAFNLEFDDGEVCSPYLVTHIIIIFNSNYI